jgi:hypothetical protein
MLVVVIIFILTFALIGGVVYFSTKKNEEPPISDSGGSLAPTDESTPLEEEPESVPEGNLAPTGSTYPKARYVRVSKNALIEKWEERPIVLNEVYVYGKDGKNIALKKPIAANSSGRGYLSPFNDGDEMTLGHTIGGGRGDEPLQRQHIEIDLGSIQEIQSVVLLMKGIDKGLLVTLFDDKLNVVSMTRELTIEDTNKGSKHKFDFGTSKWSVLPVDCVGKWGLWSKCSAGCNMQNKDTVGIQKRDWITLRKAENGGKACVYDLDKDGFKECKGTKGYWTEWSGCAREYRVPRQGICSCIKTRTFVQVSPSTFGCPHKETVKCGNPHFIPRSPQGCLC